VLQIRKIAKEVMFSKEFQSSLTQTKI